MTAVQPDHTTTPTAAVQAFFELWNLQDQPAREAAAQLVFTDDATLIDPDWTATGRPEITDAIGAARRDKLGDLRLDLAEVLGTHHDTALFTWHLTKPDDPSTPLMTGHGLVELEAGRIRRAYNYFG
ncbi:nuclear transport factor 2 family protein [Embleya sp. AB8]|uniref:nuclear transport factor 2 family protein n=1 Tax=Embleya sp. AB8 TaxID=3156304 RepID=UPI003C73BB8D